MKSRRRDVGGWAVAGVLAIISLVTGLMAFGHKSAEIAKFPLSEVADAQGEVLEITADEFANLVEEKKSFVVIAHMTVCPAEFPLTTVAKQFAREQNVVLYALTEEEFKQTSLADAVKYLPSAAIYHEGELVTYLDAEKDEDVPYYKSVDGFGEWFKKYIVPSA